MLFKWEGIVDTWVGIGVGPIDVYYIPLSQCVTVHNGAVRQQFHGLGVGRNFIAVPETAGIMKVLPDIETLDDSSFPFRVPECVGVNSLDVLDMQVEVFEKLQQAGQCAEAGDVKLIVLNDGLIFVAVAVAIMALREYFEKHTQLRL